MPRLVRQPVRSQLYGCDIETGVDSVTQFAEVGSTGDHWCVFTNGSQSPRWLKLTGTIKERDGVRYRRFKEGGEIEEHLKWSESVPLPPLPGARWLSRPEPEQVELHHVLAVVHLAEASVSLGVRFKHRPTDRGPWNLAGEAVLRLQLGKKWPSHGRP